MAGGDERDARGLKDATRQSRKGAEANGYETIALPGISAGIYGYPTPAAAEIAVNSVWGYLATHSHIKQAIFVCFDDENTALYQRLLMQHGFLPEA